MKTSRYIAIIISSFLMASCVINPNKISIAYPNWAEGIAVTHLAREILVEQGFQVELLNADIAPYLPHLRVERRTCFLTVGFPLRMSPISKSIKENLKYWGKCSTVPVSVL